MKFTPEQSAILHAFADNKEVQFRVKDDDMWEDWQPATINHFSYYSFHSVGISVEFRVKPDTITINGKEINAPVRTLNIHETFFTVKIHGNEIYPHTFDNLGVEREWLVNGGC